MKTMKWMLGLILAGTLAVQADEAAFWRVNSAITAVN